MRSLRRPDSRTTSRPKTSARPASGNNRVAKIEMRVVLPAPLGPNTPKMAPGSDREVHLAEHLLDRAP